MFNVIFKIKSLNIIDMSIMLEGLFLLSFLVFGLDNTVFTTLRKSN